MQHPTLNNPHVSPENSSQQWLKPNLFFCHILSYSIPALSLPWGKVHFLSQQLSSNDEMWQNIQVIVSTWKEQQHNKSRAGKAAVGPSFALEPSLWKWRCKWWHEMIKEWCIHNTLPVFSKMYPHAQPAMFSHQSCTECHQDRVCHTFKFVGTPSTLLDRDRSICHFFGEYTRKRRRNMPICTQQICKQVTKDDEYLSLTPTPTAGKHCLKSLHSNHLHTPDATTSQSWPAPALPCSESHWVISLENKKGRSISDRWQTTFLPDPKKTEV